MDIRIGIVQSVKEVTVELPLDADRDRPIDSRRAADPIPANSVDVETRLVAGRAAPRP